MEISVVILVLSFLEVYDCYENLCRRNTTTVSQSSTYQNQEATLANDGDLRTNYRYCSHTGINKTVAWFQVDLGKPYSISNVTLYYRNEGLVHMANEWKPYRLRQFYLDVSDLPASQTSTEQRTRCYTDNTTHPDVLSHVIDVPCKETGRYVIVETTYDAPEDDPVTGAMLEICEIQVYGCETGFYGDSCTPCKGCQKCQINSGNCDCLSTCINKSCDSTNGHCTVGCKTGYWDPTCSSVCPDNCQDQGCFRDNGLCVKCTQGFWGRYCNQTCSIFCNGKTCIQSNGRCNQGCIIGRYGDACDKACSPRCVAGSCNSRTGVCSTACYQNWMGTRCDRCDSTHYGVNCSKNCSKNCIIGCTKNNGVCYKCEEGRFGEYCDKKCGLGCVSGCDQYNGQCTCKLGWKSDKCEDCSPSFYGGSCTQQCSPNCLYGTCFKNNGTCEGGCKCSVIEELSQQIQQLQNSRIEIILYVEAGFLGVSLILNLIFIQRNIRCNVFKSTEKEDSTTLQMISRVSCNETYYLNPVDLLYDNPKERSSICYDEAEVSPQPHYAHIKKTHEKNTDGQTFEKNIDEYK